MEVVCIPFNCEIEPPVVSYSSLPDISLASSYFLACKLGYSRS